MEKENNNNLGKFFAAILIICIFIAFFKSIKQDEQKENDSVKRLASSYNYVLPAEIEIIKTFEDKGKKVYILKIENSICEMPTIKINDNLTATGITCRR